jgi:hypothetical protein
MTSSPPDRTPRPAGTTRLNTYDPRKGVVYRHIG